MDAADDDEAQLMARPFTEGSFQEKIDEFVSMLRDMSMQDVEATPEARRQMISENLRFDEFCAAIRSLFGSDVRSHDLKCMYRKLTTNPDAKIDWTEIFGYLQNEKEELDQASSEDITVFTCGKKVTLGDAAGDRKRRDTVQCMAIAPSIDCYLSISQKKTVTVWSSKLKLQACTELNEQSWATAIDYMPAMRRVVASTERSINFLDHRAKGKNQQIFSVKPLTQSPQTLCWVPFGRSSQEDTILFGDDQGFINFMTITQKDLTPRQVKGDKRMLQSFDIEPASLTVPIRRKKCHGDWVLRVKYFPELKCFGSCSPCQESSLVLEPVEKIWQGGEIVPAVINKGVNAFDYCPRANVVVTGGVDKVVRVWHPHIWSRPNGKLIGHLFTISDVVCNDKDQHIISLSTARVFRVWDIHTLSCLQIFTDTDERPGERRIYAIAYDNRHDRLLSGSSVIEAWPLTRAVQDTMQVPHTHDRPIVQVLLNRELHQVVTVCTEPVLKVWEVETGRLVYQIVEPHGAGIEVTAMTVDWSGYRLATGAFNGSVSVWDFGSGQEIKTFQGHDTDDDLSIIGLVYTELNGHRCIVASGWSNQIKVLLDPNEGGRELLYLRSFSDEFCYSMPESKSPTAEPASRNTINPYAVLPEIGDSSPTAVTNLNSRAGSSENLRLRRERLLQTHEITAQDTLVPDLLITGCLNGNIMIWDLSQALVDKLVMLPRSETNRTGVTHRQKVHDPFRVNVVRVLVHRVRKLDPAYIKRLTRKGLLQSEAVPSEADDNKENATLPSAASKRNTRSSLKSVARASSRGADQLMAPPSAAQADQQQQQPDDALHDKASPTADGAEAMPSFVDDDGDGDPDRHMIVESFPPVIVSGHEDGRLRFWDLEGELLCSVSPESRHADTCVTAIGADRDAAVLVAGDKRGYLTQFDVGQFLERPQPDPATGAPAHPVSQVVYWRAHLSRVVCLEHLPANDAFVSASADGSARLWWGRAGRFVGFFGQVRPITTPPAEEAETLPTALPYDISERPVVTQQRSQSAKQKARATRNMEYPLQFLESRWDPFSRTRFLSERREEEEAEAEAAAVETARPRALAGMGRGRGLGALGQYRRDILEKPLEKKFFKAVIKPKAYNHHLESYCSGEKREGAVFRALPVYRVGTPTDVKPPSGLLYVDLDRPTDIRKNKKILKKISTMRNPNDGRETQLSKYGQSSNGSRRSSIVGSLPKTVR